MKLTSQEEYGLRCLVRIARERESLTLTIPEISRAEGVSTFYVAKLMRILRRGGFVKSVRGQAGGYALARPSGEIHVGEVLALLGGRLYDPAFCEHHSGADQVCTHSLDCSIRSLWNAVQLVVDHVLYKTTLKELVANEQDMAAWVSPLIKFSSEQHTART